LDSGEIIKSSHGDKGDIMQSDELGFWRRGYGFYSDTLIHFDEDLSNT